MAQDNHFELMIDDAIWAEGPRWRDGSLHFSDIGANCVRRLHPDGRCETVAADIPGASGLGWTADGDMLVASIGTSTVYRIASDGAVVAQWGPQDHGTRGTNDMASANGRSYVTCAGRDMGPDDTMEEVSQPCGTIVMIDHASGACRIVASGYRMPNGVAFTPDGERLVVSELFSARLLEFRIGPDGALEDERVFAALHAPCDGLCMDAEGAVWAATYSDFSRYDNAGNCLTRIPVDGWTCIACALGGEDGRDLYLVVSQSERPQDIFEGKSRSRILRTRVAVPAAPALA